MLTVGVMSDTHQTVVTDRLRRIVEERLAGTDLILHAGDIVSGAVLDYLTGCGVMTVRGNMDFGEAGDLPYKRLVPAGPFIIGLIHGWGAPGGLARRVRNEFADIDCLVYGHSHQPDNRRVGRELVFNPGSALSPRGRTSGTVGILRVDETITGEILIVE